MEKLLNSTEPKFFLIVGPQKAGKTSLIYRLYSGIFYQSIQLVERIFEEVQVDTVRLRALNILENKMKKEIWEPLAIGASGVIFIIDCSETSNIEARSVFFKEIRTSSPLKNIPMAIFGNKIDIGHFSELQLMKELELPEEQLNESFLIQGISCRTTDGIRDGMAWLMEKTNLSFYIPAFRKIHTS